MIEGLETKILNIHRRNGGDLSIRPLLDSCLQLDSLVVDEIMAWLEIEHGVHPFEGPRPPATWGDVDRYCASGSPVSLPSPPAN